VDQKAIETKAVNAVRDIIVESEYLDQIISDNDKEPAFDGFVYVYSKPNKKKINQIGRIPVQVKGTQRKVTSNAPYINSSVSTDDLRIYLNEGGAFYFVVHISQDGKVKRIFYDDLLPVKVMKILSNANKQASITIKLKPFPTDTELMRGIFVSFLDHKKKQVILNDLKEIPKLEDLQRSGHLDQITFTTAGSQRYSDHFDAILNDEVYIYATLKGSTAHHPIDLWDHEFERVVSFEREQSVTINDTLYYSQYTFIRATSNFTLKFGQSTTLTFPYQKHEGDRGKAKINYTPADSLAVRVSDLEFWIEAVKTECIHIDGEPILITLDNKPLVDKWEDELNFWKKTRETLLILNISEDISIKSMSENDYREINTLIRAFVDKEPLLNIRKDLPLNYTLTVCGLKIALLHIKPCESDNNSRIIDYFSDELIIGFKLAEGGDKEDHFVPVYGVLDKDSWATVSNINFDDVVPSFNRIYDKHSDNCLFRVANESLLSMLLAYDETQKERLLHVATHLSNWLLEKCPEDVLWKNVRLINYLQAVKRGRELSKSERIQLLEIAEDSTMEAQVRAGACLLLDNRDSAEFHLHKLKPSVRADFIKYPIYLFEKQL